jgi:exopolysaccharide biosynthesis operon protein EpsL
MSDIRHTRHAALVGGLAALAVVQVAPAFAEAETPLKFTASQDARHDSNIFQSSKDFMRLQGYEKLSDTIYTTQAGLSFDKEYSRQGLHAGLAVGRTTYHEYNEYNSSFGSGSLNWDWRIGDHWSGVLGYDYSQSSVPLGDSFAKKDSLTRRLGRGVISANYWFHPDWAIGARFSSAHSDYNDSGWNENDEYKTVESNLDLTYRPSTGNSIVLSLRNEEGEYKNQPKIKGYLSEWTQRDVRLSGSWQLTGVTRVSGYIGYGQREYEYASNRDFKGLIGSIAFHWAPSSKVYVDLSWRREVGADIDEVSNFVTSHVWTLRPVWVVSDKVRLGARYEYRQRKFGGDPGTATPQYAAWIDRDDRWWVYGADIQYMPVNFFSVSLGYDYAKRDSNYKLLSDRYDYTSRSAWLSGRFTF